MSNLDKNSIINMENTASYQPRSNLNVVFSTADRDSAVFIFNVTKGNKPLLLSSENVIGHIALKHSDGSFVKDTLHFTEPDINGRFEYYIPNDILKREGTVTMQIFISEKGNSNVTVAERIVTFDIEKSIVGQISAETKLQYIVEYDELKAIIANRVTDIEDNMANAEDYVSQLKQAREKGLTDIEVAKTDSFKALNDLADKRLEEINNKASEYSSKFNDDKQYMDEKFEAFKSSVNGSGLVTTGESANWQKYKLTEENSQRIRMSDIDPAELNSGFYQMWGMKNAPVGSDDNTQYWNVDVTSARDGVKQIVATISSSGKTYKKNVHRDVDSGWNEVAFIDKNNPFETTQGSQVKATTAENNAKQYTDDKVNSQHTILFEGSASGVDTKIPLSESIYNYKLITISGTTPAKSFCEVVIPRKINENIVISIMNLKDSDGELVTFYELKIDLTNKNTLTLSNDIFYDYYEKKSSGPNANRFEILSIEGWK